MIARTMSIKCEQLFLLDDRTKKASCHPSLFTINQHFWGKICSNIKEYINDLMKNLGAAAPRRRRANVLTVDDFFIFPYISLDFFKTLMNVIYFFEYTSALIARRHVKLPIN